MDDLTKLRHLIEHWIEHNEEHGRTYSEWAERARAAGNKELAEALSEIGQAQRKLDPLFQRALKAAGCQGDPDHGHSHDHSHSHGHHHDHGHGHKGHKH